MAYPLAIVLGSFLELEAPELDPSPSSAASPVMGKAATVIPGSPPPGAWPLAIAIVGQVFKQRWSVVPAPDTGGETNSLSFSLSLARGFCLFFE